MAKSPQELPATCLIPHQNGSPNLVFGNDTPRKQVEDEENTKEDAWVPGENGSLLVEVCLILINHHPLI